MEMLLYMTAGSLTAHHCVTSLAGPSPDWILGVSGLDLCLKNCSWMEEKVIDLGLFDAGTDSGITYEVGPVLAATIDGRGSFVLPLSY